MDDEADTGGAERAFAALRAEVAALRQAIEGQTAPDYALTLGAIVKELRGVGARLDATSSLAVAGDAGDGGPAGPAQGGRTAGGGPSPPGAGGAGGISSRGGRRSRMWRT